MMTRQGLPPNYRSRTVATAAFVIIAGILISVGCWYYLAEEKEITREKYQTLAAIGDLKARQIQDWRKERLAEAERAAKDKLIGKTVADFLSAPSDSNFQRELYECLKLEIPRYVNILLFDPNSNLVFFTDDARWLVTATTQEAIRTALTSPGAVMSDFFRSDNGTVHIDVAVAVRDSEGRPLAVMVLRSHASDDLFSLVQFWPTISPSTETVFAQREGKEVVIVNELRFALKEQRFPLTHTSLPAVQAALGKQGEFEGRDYRDVAVLADLHPIPGTSWFLVSKMDQEEILADARYRAGIISLIIGLFLLLVAIGVAYFYRRKQVWMVRDLLKAKLQQAETQETYRQLFESMLDGFALHEIICDTAGKPVDYRFLSVNPAFERMTGLYAKDVVGRTVKEIIPGTEPIWIEQYGRVAQTGESVQFEEYSSALKRHFKVTAFSSQAGQFATVVDDITEKKAAEIKIARLTQFYSALSQCNQAIVKCTNENELLQTICQIVVQFGGMKMAWIAKIDGATGKLHEVASFGSGTEYLENIEISSDARTPFGRGPTGTAIREGKPVWCQDFQSDPNTAPWHDRSAAFGWNASGAIPLRLNGKVMGTLTIYSDMPHVFDEEACELFVEMADDISFALDNFAREEVRKHADEAARQEQELNTAIIESIPGTFYMLDKNSRFVRWNAYERDEIIGKPDELVPSTDAFDTIHPEDRAFLQSKISSVLRKGVVEVAEARIFLRGGPAFKWFLLTGRRMMINGSPFLLGIGIDITERKKAEEELQNLRTAVEQSASTIVITDPRGNIEYVNPAFEKNTGYTAAEAHGQNPRVLKSGEQNNAFYRDLWTTILSGKIWQGEFHNRRKDGSLYWESATISPVHNDRGEIVHFIAIKDNITQRKAMEASLKEALIAAEAGNKAKSEFFAVMSHELRTPLNGVLGFAELLTYTSLDKEQKSYAETISKSGNHLLAILNDILDFSSIEKGAMTIHVEPLTVVDLVRSSGQAVQKSAMDKRLAFRSEIDPGVPEQILGDGRRISQILINLLGNAVKFTSSGSVVLRVERASVGGKPALDFSVEDTGIGISTETMGILFKPFTQADTKMNRAFGGTGLGLAISQRLADAMGGKITVVSTPGRGSTFTFHLPLETPPSAGEPCTLSVLPQNIADGNRLPHTERSPRDLVLVVEDDPDNRMLAGKMVQNLGYRVEFATHGGEAVEAFAPGKYLAILMDIQMPVMNGLDATAQIRRLESGSHVPIIALTANVMPGDRERYLACGLDDFLSKPFKREQLANKLAHLV